MLGVSIISGRDLDDIRSNEIDALETADDGAEFAGRPAAGFGGSCGGRDWRWKPLACGSRRTGRGDSHTSRIQGIDVDTQIHGFRSPDSILDLLDDARHADRIDLPCLDDLEAAVSVVVVVGQAGKGGADAGVDVGVVGQQAFFVGVVEVRAVVDGGLFRGRAAEDFGSPGVAVDLEDEQEREEERMGWVENVQVGVKVDDADGTVGSCDAAEERQGDGVVAAEGDDSGECLAFE